MTTPMLEPISVARLEEARQARAIGEIALESRPLASGMLCYSAPGSWSNTAVGVGLDRPLSEAELDELVAFFVSRGVEPRLELCPFVDPALFTTLAARGFTLRGVENCLARRLDDASDPRAGMTGPWPEGIDILPVDQRDASMVDAYARFTAAGFAPPDTPVDETMVELCRRSVLHPRSRCLVATARAHEPAPLVGVAGMEVCGEVAAFWGVVVREDHRRRGVQQALLAARIKLGRELGARVATIGSKPGMPTERNAMRMGFHVAYTRFALAKAGPGLVPSAG